MKFKILIIILLSFGTIFTYSQSPVDVYKKPLKVVLADIEKKYHVKLEYSESLVNGIEVLYPTWRYRSGIEATLTNILMPFDMIFSKTEDNVYHVVKYAYHQRPVEEGQKHLEKLLDSYPLSIGLGEAKGRSA